VFEGAETVPFSLGQGDCRRVVVFRFRLASFLPGPVALSLWRLILRAVLGSYLVYLCLAGVVVFQGYVTYRVWRSQAFEREQKNRQARLVWLVPLLGAAIVISVLVEEESHLLGKKDNTERRS